MKKISEITEKLNPYTALPARSEVPPIRVDEQTARLVNLVFTKLQGIFPAWRVAWPNELALQSAKREWIAGFVQGGIRSDTQLAFGFKAARRSARDFIPSVGTFIAWCSPAAVDMGLPCEGDAWYQAQKGVYTHAAVRIAAEATSTFDLQMSKHGDKPLRERFERNYAIVVGRAQRSEPLDGHIPQGIGHDATRTPQQIQLEHSRQEAMHVVAVLGIPVDPESARAHLLAQLHIRRPKHV